MADWEEKRDEREYGCSVFRTDLSGGTGGAVTASRQVAVGRAKAILGWAVAETSGTTAAAFRLRDGSGTTGEVLVRINLAANESTRDYFGPEGFQCRTGRVYLEFISGSFEGVIYWR